MAEKNWVTGGFFPPISGVITLYRRVTDIHTLNLPPSPRMPKHVIILLATGILLGRSSHSVSG